MAMDGTGCFIAWHDLQPGQEASHDHWHTHEHIIERVAIPGFRRGRRYRRMQGGPRVCVMYQVDSLAVLSSPAYLERLNTPTPWTRRSMGLFVGMNRSLCHVVSTHGHGVGGHLLTLQLGPQTDASERLQAWLADEALPALAARAGLCGAHLLIADQATSRIGTQEKRLRGGSDAVSDWVVLVEAYDQEALMQANAELAGGDGLVAHGAGGEIAARLYCLDFTLDDQEAKRIWRPPSEAPAA